MKLHATLLACLLAAALSAAGQKPANPPAAPASDKPPAGVPPKATLVEPGTWKATDAKGKVWLYKVSPFGISKVAEKSDAPRGNVYAGTVSAAEKPSNVVAAIEGDTIHFSQPTPFGTKKWTRKIGDDMENDEKAAVDRARQASSTPTGK